MSEARVESLFDEFALAYVRGERPNVRDFLERAGGEREELGHMLDRFLAAVPAREPTEEETVALQARLEQQPPLLLLRLRRALAREKVVEALVAALGLDPAKSAKVGRYYHDLEVGRLDPSPVDKRVWDVLAETLAADVRALAEWRPELPAAPAAVAFRREPNASFEVADAAAPAPAEPAAEEPDEVDRLFTGTS